MSFTYAAPTVRRGYLYTIFKEREDSINAQAVPLPRHNSYQYALDAIKAAYPRRAEQRFQYPPGLFCSSVLALLPGDRPKAAVPRVGN